MSLLTKETKNKLVTGATAALAVDPAELAQELDPWARLYVLTFTPEEGEYTVSVSFNDVAFENR